MLRGSPRFEQLSLVAIWISQNCISIQKCPSTALSCAVLVSGRFVISEMKWQGYCIHGISKDVNDSINDIPYFPSKRNYIQSSTPANLILPSLQLRHCNYHRSDFEERPHSIPSYFPHGLQHFTATSVINPSAQRRRSPNKERTCRKMLMISSWSQPVEGKASAHSDSKQ